MRKLDMKKFLNRLPILSVLTLTWFYAFHRIASSDTFWHLATGYRIIENRFIPHYDIYSYTCEGCKWIDLHWLFQVIIALVHIADDIRGLVLFKSLMAVLIVALLIACATKEAPGWLTALMVLAGLRVSWDAFGLRPTILSYAFLVFELLILEKHRSGSKKILWILPIVQMLWVNIHGLFVLGILLQLSYFVPSLTGILLRRIKNKSGKANKRDTIYQGLILTASILFSLCNPYFTDGALFPLTLFSRISGEIPIFKNTIGEFISPFWGDIGKYFKPVNYYFLVGLGIVSFIANFKNFVPALFFVWVIFFSLSAMAYRNVALFSFVSIPILVLNFQNAFSSIESKYDGFKKITKALEASITAAICLFCIFRTVDIVTNNFYRRAFSIYHFGVGIEERIHPVKAMNFLGKWKIRGRIYNSLNFGDYFIWRASTGEKVFIDGRLEVYNSALYEESTLPLAMPHLWDDFSAKWNISYVLLMHMNPAESHLVSYLLKHDNWKLVYYDELACIFLKDIPQYQEIITKNFRDDFFYVEHKSQTLSPNEFTPRKKKLSQRLARLFQKAPETFTYLGFANFFMIAGKYESAKQELYNFLRADNEISDIHILLGQLSLKEGDYQSAQGWFENALLLEPANIKAVEGHRLACYYLGDVDCAK